MAVPSTYAPADIIAIQTLWHRALGTPADVAAVVGRGRRCDTYHCGARDLRRRGQAPEQIAWQYAVLESLRDRGGLTDAASALDLPTPTQALRDVITRVVHLANRGDNRCRDVRAVRWSPDGRLCRRWDDLDECGPLDDRQHLRFAHLALYRDGEGRRARRDNVGGLLADLLAEVG